MRRSAVLALTAALIFFAAPALAQSPVDLFWMNTNVGPSFGTFGTTAAADLQAGWRLNDSFSLMAELGALPRADLAKSRPIVSPALLDQFDGADGYVNGVHWGINLTMRPSSALRLSPYGNIGVGAFTGTMVLDDTNTSDMSSESRRTTSPAFSVGGGLTYPLNRWLGVNADYRHFFVDTVGWQHVNRLRAGLTFFLK